MLPRSCGNLPEIVISRTLTVTLATPGKQPRPGIPVAIRIIAPQDGLPPELIEGIVAATDTNAVVIPDQLEALTDRDGVATFELIPSGFSLFGLLYEAQLSDNVIIRFSMPNRPANLGALIGGGAAPVPIIILDEGVTIAESADTVDFIGDGVTATASGDTVTVTVPTVAGPEGPQGDQGDQGTQGDQGAQGDPGTPGAQGAQGDQGDQGAQGDQGDQGDAGPTGPAGTGGGGGVATSLGSLTALVRAVPQAFTLSRALAAGSALLILCEETDGTSAYDSLPDFLWDGLTAQAVIPTDTSGSMNLSIDRIYSNTSLNSSGPASLYVWRTTATTGWVSVAGGSGALTVDTVTFYEVT